MSYKPAMCPDCKSDVQMCCCQAWAKNSQSEIYEYEDKWLHQRIEELEKEVSIMREALEQIADPHDYAWYREAENAEYVVDAMIAMARVALNKAGGE